MLLLSIEVEVDMSLMLIKPLQKRWREVDAELQSIDPKYRKKRHEKPIGALYL
jgi:hypothetical protein